MTAILSLLILAQLPVHHGEGNLKPTLLEEGGLLRRHQFAFGTSDPVSSPVEAAHPGNKTKFDQPLKSLHSLKANVSRKIPKPLRQSLPTTPQLETPGRFPPSPEAAGNMKASAAQMWELQVSPLGHAFGDHSVFGSRSRAENRGLLYRVNDPTDAWNHGNQCSFVKKGKCQGGYEVGFEGLDEIDCFAACLSHIIGDGVTAGDSGLVSRMYSIPSGCFCCDKDGNKTATVEPHPAELYDLFTCKSRVGQTTIGPPYDDGSYIPVTTTTTTFR